MIHPPAMGGWSLETGSMSGTNKLSQMERLCARFYLQPNMFVYIVLIEYKLV